MRQVEAGLIKRSATDWYERERSERLAGGRMRSKKWSYRLYSLKAHELIARLSDSEATVSLHSRIAANLSRSLAANLSREDARAFQAMHTPVETT